MAHRFRQAICNEVFEGWKFEDTCRAVKQAGYDGIEIAPFTLAETPQEIGAWRRRDWAAVMAGEGLGFVGLHWLMVSPKGLHVTTPDAALRQRSWDHIRALIDLCADLAGGQADKGVMVFGSPKQRSSTGGLTPAEATRHYVEGLAAVAPQAESRGVRILVEALGSDQSDIVNTVAEAAAIVGEIGSPAVQTMFDTHNTTSEAEPHPVLVDRFFEVIRHVHINEMDGRHPGTGDYPFGAVFEVLSRRKYGGWVSMEAFDFSAGGVKIATDSLRYIEGIESRMGL
jgi:sugar phosphate isomerase/epimerase